MVIALLVIDQSEEQSRQHLTHAHGDFLFVVSVVDSFHLQIVISFGTARSLPLPIAAASIYWGNSILSLFYLQLDSTVGFIQSVILCPSCPWN